MMTDRSRQDKAGTVLEDGPEAIHNDFMKSVVVLLLGFGSFTACVQSEEIEIFRGVPEVKYEVTKEASNREKIKENKQKTLGVVITKRGDEYFWKSRGDRKLILSKKAWSSVCYFIDPSGGGSIKVITTHAETSKDIEYIEQISLVGATVQYFGKGSYFFFDELKQ